MLPVLAHGAGITPKVLISVPDVRVVSIAELDIFTKVTFNEISENMIFSTKWEISVIQIFNAEGDMEFQLPVMSDQVQINKSLFGEGEFRLGFIVKGQEKVHLTEVTIR